MGAFVLDVNLRIADVLGLQKVQQQIASVTGGATGGGGGGGAQSVQANAAKNVAAATAIVAANNKISESNSKVATSSQQAGNAVAKSSTEIQKGRRAAESFGQQIGLAGRRYAAFIAATAVPFAGLAILREATQSIIELDKAIVGVRQITGESEAQVGALREQILSLSVATGTSASELAGLAQTLAQANIRGEALSSALEQLAKVPLTPVFGSTQSALEGLLAVTNQFEDQALSASEVFDVLANVSLNFAATAEDLFQGFARGGAAFEAVGGTFEEFAAALAVVRQETRESASTVGTFFKTISSRIADPKIRAFLEGKGIRLFDETGQFIGPINAFRAISEALENIVNVQDKVEIATRVAGRRQVSRFLALAGSIDEVDRGINLAQNSAGAFGRIAEQGLTTLRAQIDIVIARFNQLFQTLAEPVFVPIIRGFTSAATAAASLIEFLSPIIPIFTQLVAFSGGIKLLTLSIQGLQKAAAALAILRFTGLTNLAQLGATGAAAGTAAAAGGTLAAGGGAAANTALAATTATIVSTGKKLVQSQLGQIAITGLVIAGFDKLADSSEEAGNASAQFAATLIRNLAGITAGLALLSGATPAGLIRGAFGSLFGGLIGAGTIIAAGVTAASSQAARAIEESGRAASVRISEIDIDFDDDANLQTAVGELGQSIVDRIRDAASQFRNLDTGEQDLQQLILSAGKGLVDLFSGQRGITGPLITDEQANELIDNLLGDNAEQAGAIVQQAIVEFGNDFRAGLLRQLTNIFGTTEEGIVLSERIIQRLIEQQGVVGITSAKVRALKIREEQEQQRFTNNAQKIANSLAAVTIPTAIASDFNLLQEAVRATVNSIDSNVRAFDTLAGSIGQISVPDLSFDITERAIGGLVTNPQALAELGGDAFGDLTQQVARVQELRLVLERLAQTSAAAAQGVDQLDLEQTLGDPTAAREFIRQIIDNFILAEENIPPDIANLLRAGGQELVRQSLTAFSPDPELIDETLTNLLPDALSVSESVGERLGEVLNIILQDTQLQLEQQAALLRQTSQRTRLPDIAQNFNQLAEDLSPLIQLPQTTANNLEGIARQLATIGLSAAENSTFLELFREESQRAANAIVQLNIAAREDASAIPELSRELFDAQSNVNLFRAAASALITGLQADLDNIDPSTPGSEATRRRFERAIEILRQGLNEAQTEAAVLATTNATSGGRFASAVDIFGENVSEFERVISSLAESLNIPQLAEGGASAARDIEAEILRRTQGSKETERNVAAFGTEDISGVVERFNNAASELIRESTLGSAAFLVGLDNTLEDFIRRGAAEQIGAEAGRRAQEQRLPNAENIAKNVTDLLLGRITGSEEARITLEAQKASKASLDLNTQAIRQSIEQERNLANELRESSSTGTTRLPEFLAPTTRTENIQGNEDVVNELTQLREIIDRIPEGQVITPELIESLRREQDTQIDRAEPLNADDLEAAIVPAITNSLTSSLQPLENLQDADQRDGSTTEIVDAINRLSSSVIAEEDIGQTETGTDTIRSGTELLASASDRLLSGIGELSAVIDIQRETLRSTDNTGITTATSELAEVSRANTNAIKEQSQNLIELNQRLAQGINNNVSENVEQNIQIDGLEDTNNALRENSVALSATETNFNNLSSELSNVQTALRDGLRVALEAAQNIDINVRGLENIVTEASDQFEEVATNIAREQIRIALSSLTNTLGDPNLVQSFETVLNNLA